MPAPLAIRAVSHQPQRDRGRCAGCQQDRGGVRMRWMIDGERFVEQRLCAGCAGTWERRNWYVVTIEQRAGRAALRVVR